MYLLLFLLPILVRAGLSSSPHFSISIDSVQNNITLPLIYNSESQTYQLSVDIQNGLSVISDFPMDLNSTSPFFEFLERNMTINQSEIEGVVLNLDFTESVILNNQTVMTIFKSDQENSPKSISRENYQGIFGFGLLGEEDETTGSYLTIRGILNQFEEANLINNPVVSLYLGSFPDKSNDSTLTFGGYNTSLMSNEILYNIAANTSDSWSFNLLAMEIIYMEENILMGNVFSSLDASIDIAEPNILLPLDLINEFITICAKLYITCNLIPSTNTLYCKDEYSFLTSSYPYIAFFFTSDLFLAIDPEMLIYDCSQSEQNIRSCFVRIGLSPKNTTLSLGQVFLRNTYTIFYFNNNSLAFSFESLNLESSSLDEIPLNYTFYALLTIWGMTMVGCGLYFRGYLIRLNIMTNKISKIFYDKIKNALRGNNQQVDIEESEEDAEEENPPANIQNNGINNLNNNANA